MASQFNNDPNYKRFFFFLFIISLFLIIYNYIFFYDYKNKNNETNIVLEKTEKINTQNIINDKINNNYMDNINYWQLEMAKIIISSRSKNLNNKNKYFIKNISNTHRCTSIINNVGGKLDSYTLKNYCKDVIFQFTHNDIGGALMLQSRNFKIPLKISDSYTFSQTSAGSIALEKIINDNIIIKKIYTFSILNNTILYTIEIINKNNKKELLELDLIISISNIDEEKSDNIKEVFKDENTIIVKCNNKKKEFPIDKISNNIDHKITGKISYVAINHRYFLVAIIPENDKLLNSCILNNFNQFSIDDNNILTKLTNIILCLNPIEIKKSSNKKISFKIYLGPKQINNLKTIGYNLDENIEFGFFGVISKPMLWLLVKFHILTGNFGVAIILLTFLIKLITFPLTQKSLVLMQKTKQLNPELQILQKKYSHDKTLLGQKQLELYKKHKVNPLAGCLPMIVQMPIWITLYQVLWNSVELYQQPFILWIQDLTSPDQYYILPILMGISMFIQIFVQPGGATGSNQETMKYVMWGMPFFLTIVMLTLPSGLSLYMLSNNIFTIGQNLYIKKSIKHNK